MPAKSKLTWDEAHGSVLFEKTGFWSQQDSQTCMSEMVLLLAQSRLRNGTALLLIDATHTCVQSTDYMNGAKEVSGKTMQKGDGVAIVVACSLVKMQLNRIGSDHLTYSFFLSRSAAETWLFAHQRALAPVAAVAVGLLG